MTQTAISLGALAAVIAMMLGELWVSMRNERILLARGAIQPYDPVYGSMRWAYPAVFVAMAAEGAVAGGPPGPAVLWGAILFAFAKALKYWAIATLGVRWTYKVLVLPDAPLVRGGPYRLMNHPNYVGVLGELVGMALITEARWMGTLGTLFFSWLLWRRLTAEDHAIRPSVL
jgi:methyltransferase